MYWEHVQKAMNDELQKIAAVDLRALNTETVMQGVNRPPMETEGLDKARRVLALADQFNAQLGLNKQADAHSKYEYGRDLALRMVAGGAAGGTLGAHTFKDSPASNKRKALGAILGATAFGADHVISKHIAKKKEEKAKTAGPTGTQSYYALHPISGAIGGAIGAGKGNRLRGAAHGALAGTALGAGAYGAYSQAARHGDQKYMKIFDQNQKDFDDLSFENSTNEAVNEINSRLGRSNRDFNNFHQRIQTGFLAAPVLSGGAGFLAGRRVKKKKEDKAKTAGLASPAMQLANSSKVGKITGTRMDGTSALNKFLPRTRST